MPNSDNLRNFLDYLLVREEKGGRGKKSVPFVTITRDVGCEVDGFVRLLTKRLSDISHTPWSVLDKEILRLAASELKLKENELEDMLERSEHYVFDDILASFSENYYNKSEAKAKSILRDVIRDRAKQGHVVFVGRASEIITKGLRGGLRVKVHAPFEWRVDRLSKEWGVSLKEAQEMTEKAEKRKGNFRNLFKENENDYPEYDLTFNKSSLTDLEMVEILVGIYLSRWGKI
ncbi:hypothetical protein FUAX_12100 [Fulvitalea axinellae]|uniref:Cytidylate kinase-like family protein n=1 Tax=Fulvitalea axinellae TaxID=1182444 RepID=A0AAU9CL63_9BACT|nr:hypothetical protein FUAX_12100 [Fulvitalea axinellae]